VKARLIVAVLLPFAACALQWLLWDAYIKPYVWFLFFPAAFFSAWLGGLRGGLAGTVVGALLVWYVFIPPRFDFALETLASGASIVMFVAMGGLFSWFFERLTQAMRRTDAALAETRSANARITELYNKTRELDELKSRFFANVSHELRTPLTLIMSPLSQRLASPDEPEDARREDEMMLRNARLLYRHVSDLLDAAKLEAGRMAVDYACLDMGMLIRAMVSQFDSMARERGIDCRLDVPVPFLAEADGAKLQRILLNLLSNAFKFTPDGGRVEVRLREEGGRAVIEVADNGPGVPADLRQAVFERFRQVEGGAQRRYGGTGLGLAIVKDFVELHGGTVAVAEAPGGGASFRVTLPLAAPAGTALGEPTALDGVLDRQAVEELETRPAEALTEAAADGERALVLVVEDNADMNAFIARVLHPRYRVVRAFDGREGLDKALALKPDLILTDVMMPAMSGDEMVLALRQRPEMADVPIVMLTARADDDLRLRMLKVGVQDYLNKPFGVEELLARVGSLADSRRRTVVELGRSAARLRRLAEVVEQVAAARDLPGLMAIVRHAVRELTGADGATLVLRDNGYCHYADEDAIGPLWKGQRFPLPHAAYRPTFVKSLAMVPVGRHTPVGAIGCYWAEHHRASAEELELQQALADAMSVGLANLDLYRESEAARRAAEQAAAEANASAAALKEAQRLAGIGNWQWDVAAGRHVWSDEVYRIYGRDPALPPADYPELGGYFAPDSWASLSAVVEQALATGAAYECDAEVVRPDGGRRWVTVRGEASRDAAGKVVEMHGTVQDITARKLAEEEIRRLNADLERRVVERTAELTAANCELDSFAYAVSHDLRAPLRAMSGFSQALVEDYGGQLPDEAKGYLKQIDIASHRMAELIDGLLALSRITRGELRREGVEVTTLASGLLGELAQGEPERRVDVTVEPGLSTRGDPRMIEAMLRNLLGNAWKYTARAGAPCIRVYSEQRGGHPWICVADNGAGFDMAYADKLFQPFQRLHRQDEFPGIGIGLATVQRIVHRHGGAIEARGEPGRGAVLSFSLPDAADSIQQMNM